MTTAQQTVQRYLNEAADILEGIFLYRDRIPHSETIEVAKMLQSEEHFQKERKGGESIKCYSSQGGAGGAPGYRA
jgi:uncharacterized short protein YbdD (DUF466 family)